MKGVKGDDGPIVSRAKKNRRWVSGKSLGELDGTPSARRDMANLLVGALVV